MTKGLFVGDGDDLYFLYEVERVFELKLSDAECEACHTMGDMERLVMRRLSERATVQDRCMSALAFYQIRRALGDSQRKVRPSTPSDDLPTTPREFASKLKREFDITFQFPLGAVGNAALLLFLIGLLASLSALALKSLPLLIAGILSAAVGLAAVKADRGSFSGVENVGALAVEVANQNFGYFVSRGARFTTEDVSRLLRELAVAEAGGRPEDITPETLLIRQRKEWFP